MDKKEKRDNDHKYTINQLHTVADALSVVQHSSLKLKETIVFT